MCVLFTDLFCVRRHSSVTDDGNDNDDDDDMVYLLLRSMGNPKIRLIKMR